VSGSEPKKRSLFVALLVLMRPKQWSKNLLAFAAILFTGEIANVQLLAPVFVIFASLCLASSTIYVVNDLLDVERDRLHPKKRFRPIAAGEVPVPFAIALAPALLLGSLGLALTVNFSAAVLVACYLALHTFYNLGMKHTAVADVFSISLGFVLRAVAGAAAINVGISGWLLFCTGALALMLGFGKRRQEFVIHGEERSKTRESLDQYSLQALDAMVMMSACAAALCYGIYSIESSTAREHPALVLTTVPVFYGVSRYILVVFTQNEGGEPESLLFSDRHILLSVVLFVAMVAVAMMGVPVPFLEART
jgi:4-hydroxybenzoate polyprenyltransferase